MNKLFTKYNHKMITTNYYINVVVAKFLAIQRTYKDTSIIL